VAKEITSEEPKWLNFESEEAQVKLDLSDLIFEKLVEEAIQALADSKK